MLNQWKIEARVTRNPAVLGGKPIIRGTRISVSLIADWLDAGVPVEQILEDYPNLIREDVEAAGTYRLLERERASARSR